MAIGAQVVAFFVTLRIRRNAAGKEGNVLKFADYKDRSESETAPEKHLQKTPDE